MTRLVSVEIWKIRQILHTRAAPHVYAAGMLKTRGRYADEPGVRAAAGASEDGPAASMSSGRRNWAACLACTAAMVASATLISDSDMTAASTDVTIATAAAAAATSGRDREGTRSGFTVAQRSEMCKYRLREATPGDGGLEGLWPDACERCHLLAGRSAVRGGCAAGTARAAVRLQRGYFATAVRNTPTSKTAQTRLTRPTSHRSAPPRLACRSRSNVTRHANAQACACTPTLADAGKPEIVNESAWSRHRRYDRHKCQYGKWPTVQLLVDCGGHHGHDHHHRRRPLNGRRWWRNTKLRSAASSVAQACMVRGELPTYTHAPTPNPQLPNAFPQPQPSTPSSDG